MKVSSKINTKITILGHIIKYCRKPKTKRVLKSEEIEKNLLEESQNKNYGRFLITMQARREYSKIFKRRKKKNPLTYN